jgi:hypothetical protein
MRHSGIRKRWLFWGDGSLADFLYQILQYPGGERAIDFGALVQKILQMVARRELLGQSASTKPSRSWLGFSFGVYDIR